MPKRLLLSDAASQTDPQPVLRIGLSPYPVDPYRWQAVVETPLSFRVATVDTRTSAIESDPQTDIFHKPAETPG